MISILLLTLAVSDGGHLVTFYKDNSSELFAYRDANGDYWERFGDSGYFERRAFGRDGLPGAGADIVSPDFSPKMEPTDGYDVGAVWYGPPPGPTTFRFRSPRLAVEDRVLMFQNSDFFTFSYIDARGRFFVRGLDGGFVELLTLEMPDGGWTPEALRQLAPPCREVVVTVEPEKKDITMAILFVALAIGGVLAAFNLLSAWSRR